MAAAASWQRELAIFTIGKVQGPLRSFALGIECQIPLSCESATDKVGRDAMKVMVDFVRRNSSDHFNEATRQKLQTLFPGEYSFIPLKEGEAGKSLSECFQGALINAAREHASALLKLRQMQKTCFETVSLHAEWCEEHIKANEPGKEGWVEALAGAQRNLEQLEAHVSSQEEEDEDVVIVENAQSKIEREILQLTVWQKHPEQLLALARADVPVRAV